MRPVDDSAATIYLAPKQPSARRGLPTAGAADGASPKKNDYIDFYKMCTPQLGVLEISSPGTIEPKAKTGPVQTCQNRKSSWTWFSRGFLSIQPTASMEDAIAYATEGLGWRSWTAAVVSAVASRVRRLVTPRARNWPCVSFCPSQRSRPHAWSKCAGAENCATAHATKLSAPRRCSGRQPLEENKKLPTCMHGRNLLMPAPTTSVTPRSSRYEHAPRVGPHDHARHISPRLAQDPCLMAPMPRRGAVSAAQVPRRSLSSSA